MSSKDMPVIAGLIIIDSAKAFYIINNNDIEWADLTLSIFDHLLKSTPPNGAGAADFARTDDQVGAGASHV